MARMTRIVLDIALVSVVRARPVVSRVWVATKSKASSNSRIKILVDNALVTKLEEALDSLTTLLASKLTTLRDQQLPLEKEYLEKELDIVKKKLSEQRNKKAASSSKYGAGDGA